MSLRDRFFGRGAHAITVPPLDGALRPNTALEEAPTLYPGPADHLEVHEGALWWASGPALLRDGVEVARYGAKITAFAMGPSGPMMALEDGTLELGVAHSLPPSRCITGIAMGPDGARYVTIGSEVNTHWVRDLMQGGASGSLWRITVGQTTCLAKGLAWPERPLVADGVIVSESSAARVLRFSPRQTVLGHLPGYPSGVCRAPSGYALAVKAPRNQLIEFILREPAFAAQMLEAIPPEHWIAPSLMPPRSFLEPLQGGALKQLGRMKPWAPSRSFGLVIELDAGFVPVRSHHSRADGQSHGVTSVAFHGALIAASQGAARILQIGGRS